MLDKVDGFIRGCNRSRYLALFGPEKNMMPFTIGLDIL